MLFTLSVAAAATGIEPLAALGLTLGGVALYAILDLIGWSRS